MKRCNNVEKNVNKLRDFSNLHLLLIYVIIKYIWIKNCLVFKVPLISEEIFSYLFDLAYKTIKQR